ncbi:MAG: hypothetical protein JWN72_2425 [Thermoleophilia bacterium]|nr:hypothetical protein [Thermoleophilia bacterium]
MLCAVVASAQPSSGASTSNSVVSAAVLTATSLDLTGCTAPGATNFGGITPATAAMTTPCAVQFGSSNGAALLSISQRDRSGTAMSRPTDDVWTVHAGAPTYRAAYASDATHVWIAGARVASSDPTPLLASTDGGSTWTQQSPCLAGMRINSINGWSNTELIAVGSRVCRTTDGGATWTTVTTGQTFNTSASRANVSPGTNVAWLNTNSSGRLMRSADRGVTWSTINVAGVAGIFSEVVGLTATSAVAFRVESEPGPTKALYAWSTTDSGVNWTKTLIVSTATLNTGFQDAAVGTSGRIIVTGHGGIGTRSSDDGGLTWTSRSSQRYWISNLSGTTWIAASRFDAPRRSTDDGATWSTIAMGGSARDSAYATSNGFGAGSALMVGESGTIMRSTDSGATWSSASTVRPSYRAVFAFDRSHFAALDDSGGGIVTSDAGTSFTPVTSCGGVGIRAGVATGATTGVAVGVGGAICRSIDAGATWQAQPSGTAVTLSTLTRAAGNGDLFAAGGTGTLLRSRDDGRTWTPLTLSAPATVVSIGANATGSTLAIGVVAVATVLVSTDGGMTWSTRSTGTTTSPTAVAVAPSGTILVGHNRDDVLNDAPVRRSVDGGVTWTTAGQVQGDEIRAIVFASDTRVRLIDEYGDSLLSDDGGATATQASTIGTVTSPIAIDILDSGTSLVAGDGSMVASSVTGPGVPDVGGGTNLQSASGAFGACLEGITGPAAASWSAAGTCNVLTPAHWHGIPLTAADPLAEVARMAAAGTSTANLRFGFRAATTTATGAYEAELTFTVLAP